MDTTIGQVRQLQKHFNLAKLAEASRWQCVSCMGCEAGRTEAEGAVGDEGDAQVLADRLRGALLGAAAQQRELHLRRRQGHPRLLQIPASYSR